MADSLGTFDTHIGNYETLFSTEGAKPKSKQAKAQQSLEAEAKLGISGEAAAKSNNT